MAGGKQDYIPERDEDFNIWGKNFDQYLQAHAGVWNLPPAMISDLEGKQTDFDCKHLASEQGHKTAKALKAAKDESRKQAEAAFRSVAQIIQAHPETTDEHRAGLGLTKLDKTKTALSPDRVLTLPPPMLHLDWSVRKQVTVHFGPNPLNEHENALPEGIYAVRIFAKVGEGAEAFLADDTNSPYLHQVQTNAPVTVTYRACYVDRKLRVGPLGQLASCTVSV